MASASSCRPACQRRQRGRAHTAVARKERRPVEKAFVRALELLDLTITDPRWKGRRKELTRARTFLCEKRRKFKRGCSLRHDGPAMPTSAQKEIYGVREGSGRRVRHGSAALCSRPNRCTSRVLRRKWTGYPCDDRARLRRRKDIAQSSSARLGVSSRCDPGSQSAL